MQLMFRTTHCTLRMESLAYNVIYDSFFSFKQRFGMDPDCRIVSMFVGEFTSITSTGIDAICLECGYACCVVLCLRTL